MNMDTEVNADDYSSYDEKLSTEYKEYLVSKHGTFELDPIPQMDDSDPLNWGLYHKVIQLAMIAFHAFSTTFMAAGLIPSFGDLSVKFNTSITACSYFTSAQIIVIGVFPLVWVPLMNRYGRLQLLIVSTLGTCAFSIGCIFATTYRSLMICRLFSAFFVSPGISVGANVVKELTFSHQRGLWTGWWALGVTLGTHVGPFLMGFVEYHTGNTKYIFITFAVMNFIQFLAYILFGGETVYEKGIETRSRKKLFSIQRRNDSPFGLKQILLPFGCLKQWKVLIPTIAYSVTFSYANVACGVELTQLFSEKFGFNSQQIGIQFISLILGCIFGEIIGGHVSDLWMRHIRKGSRKSNIEQRLWLSYPGFICAIIGLSIYGVLLQRIDDQKWRIGPLVGLFLASFGLQIVTTVLITYTIDSNPGKASESVLFITLIRQILGFVGPFYFPHMFSNPHLQIKNTYGVLAGLVAALGFIPIAMLHYVSYNRDSRAISS